MQERAGGQRRAVLGASLPCSTDCMQRRSAAAAEGWTTRLARSYIMSSSTSLLEELHITHAHIVIGASSTLLL